MYKRQGEEKGADDSATAASDRVSDEAAAIDIGEAGVLGIVEEKDENGRWVCAVLLDKCIGCGLCVTLGNTTAPQPRDFGCPADYDAINMHDWDEIVEILEAPAEGQSVEQAAETSETTT